MTSMWTAASDLDYYEGDLPESERPVERDADYENWLETHGYLDPPSDMDLEQMRVEFEQRDLDRLRRNFEQAPLVGVVDDDIPF